MPGDGPAAGRAERDALLNSDAITCPLCDGRGTLRRAEVLERLGARDLKQIASLSAKEALELALEHAELRERRHREWYQNELNRRLDEERAKSRAELEQARAELAIACRERGVVEQQAALKVEQKLAPQMAALQAQLGLADEKKKVELDRAHDLELRLREAQTRLERVSATKGRAEELDFEAEARTWPEVELGEKQRRDGDYLLWLRIRDPNGSLIRAQRAFVIDNKDDRMTPKYVEDIVGAAQRRGLPMGILVFRDHEQLRTADGEGRWSRREGVWVLCTTRATLRSDLEVLRPVIERLAQEGPEFLERESTLALEVTKTLADLDGVSRFVKQARDAVAGIEDLVRRHRERLAELCNRVLAR